MRTMEINTKTKDIEQSIRRFGKIFSAKDKRKETIPLGPELQFQKRKKEKEKEKYAVERGK